MRKAIFFAVLCLIPSFGYAAVLFEENFDNTNFSLRGWYDGASGAIDTTEHIPGSNASLKCHFIQGGTKCNPADGLYVFRHKFPASDSVYLCYWIKHSPTWFGSGTIYHPHMLLFLTNMNSDYSGLAYTFLTAYVEENQGYPVIGFQDAQNIDESKVGLDLTRVSENRSIAGCNGTQAGIGLYNVSCYLSGSVHRNGMGWRGSSPYFTDANQKASWHFIEVYFQLNSISNGIGQPSGIVRYWYDGQLVIDKSNVIIRTGNNPTMRFNQFIIAPIMDVPGGSPVDQTFWIDNLSLATARPAKATPSAPSSLTAH